MRVDLVHLEGTAGVDPVNDITVIPAPEATVQYHVTGDRRRTLAMTAILGIGATVAVVLCVDGYRRRGRTTSGDPGPVRLGPSEGRS